ncbi:cationic peroxidase 1-like [Chenopodium quinoa]|uniref:cationic peroxidase 1-like n=1 Tax=Chenopodium quinoa TaxID=63459 RepID=UPI000B78C234|nr:cationic peroxidase 1-like [Chenopodium quinoa]
MAAYSLLQLCLIFVVFGSTFAQLSENYYAKSCPQAKCIIKDEVRKTLKKEPGMGGSLLHLHFHDCGVGGCDGSILLDDTPKTPGEKSSLINVNSTWGYEVIDRIKARLEKACPGIVSCADILAAAAKDSIVTLGGPTWPLPLGRRDSTEPHKALTDTLGALFNANLQALIMAFKQQGYTTEEFVALTGSHTIGRARCLTFRKHIYDDKNINPAFAKAMQAHCPKVGNDSERMPIDSTTPYVFDNAYYKNLLQQKGLLGIDQELYTGKGGLTDAIVANYSSNQDLFFKTYVTAITKFGQTGVLTGNKGEVRTNCRKVNAPKA